MLTKLPKMRLTKGVVNIVKCASKLLFMGSFLQVSRSQSFFSDPRCRYPPRCRTVHLDWTLVSSFMQRSAVETHCAHLSEIFS